MEKIGNYFYPIVIAGVFFDQLTKYFVELNLSILESYPIINNVFHITYIFNTGAGFGILQNHKNLFIVIALIVIGAIFYYYNEIKTKEIAIFVSLILAGTIGNLIDRIRFGYVIDFIDFRIWPTFNLADTFVVIGAIGLVYIFWED